MKSSLVVIAFFGSTWISTVFFRIVCSSLFHVGNIMKYAFVAVTLTNVVICTVKSTRTMIMTAAMEYPFNTTESTRFAESKYCQEQGTNCTLCVDLIPHRCFWCPTTQQCLHYKLIPHGCNLNWFAGQCTLKGYFIVIVLPIAVLLSLLVACCFCCSRCQCRCCRKQAALGEEEKLFLMDTQRQREKFKRRRFLESRGQDVEGGDYVQYGNHLRVTYGLFHNTSSRWNTWANTFLKNDIHSWRLFSNKPNSF